MQLLPFLLCIICNRTLTAPTTLKCGHSVCSHHHPHLCCSTPIPPAPPTDVILNTILVLAHRRDDDDRPRKRHKRHHSPDLLTHLRNAATHQRSVPPDVPLIQDEVDKKLLEELTCHICYVLFYNPVTTPCQHTFCSKCLQRSLDHGSSCPICRQEIPALYFQELPINKTITNLILKLYPVLYQERADAIEQEERHARLNTPIFVCQLSFPGVPTVLHFFEPRYRLMLRRCLESPNPFFGMIMPPKTGYPPVDYGTILDIRSVQMLPDGRSMVETWGSTRFRILERGFLDGYMVGRIERIYDYRDDLAETLVLDEPTPQPLVRRIASLLHQDQDQPTAGSSTSSSPAASSSATSSSASATTSSAASSAASVSSATSSSARVASSSASAISVSAPSVALSSTVSSSSSSSSSALSASPSASASSSTPARTISSPNHPTNDELMDTCKAFLDRLQRGAAPWVVQRLSSTYGAMPTDPALFSFWVALVLPIDDREKAKLLPIKSARLRLMLVVHWIEQLNSKWWFSSGCTIL